MRVLLAGSFESYSVGAYFRSALEALGYEYALLDEGDYSNGSRHPFFNKLAYRALGRRLLTYWKYNRDLVGTAWRFKPALVLVTKGAHVSPDSLAQIKADTGAFLANYATDDPFNPANSTSDLRKGIRFYDLYACTKKAIMEDVRRAGCPNVRFVSFGYAPSMHFPESSKSADERKRFSSEVVFVGGGDPDRYPYFKSLLQDLPDLSLHLYGGYWSRERSLRRCHRGTALGRNYRLAVCSSKIAPCLVRRANRDGHCMRTFETPACGAFMVAERTEDHMELFEEHKEVAFFGHPEELTDKVRYYLRHDAERARMAEAAYRKVTGGSNTYRDRLVEILRISESLRHPLGGVYVPANLMHIPGCPAN